MYSGQQPGRKVCDCVLQGHLLGKRGNLCCFVKTMLLLNRKFAVDNTMKIGMQKM